MNQRSGSIDLLILPTKSTVQLRAVWAEYMGRAKAPIQRRLLIRELAWRFQVSQHGGFDDKTRRLLHAAMRSVTGNQVNSDAASAPAVEPPPRASPNRQALPKLRPSTRFVRTWRGERHEVVVLEGGAFRYRNRTYDSLSEIARVITAVRWSGPRFFGLRSRKAGEAN